MTRGTDRRTGLGYRPALDGLRGVAILLVLGQHAELPLLNRAGSVGVTLFFVLSGFLITTLLLQERERFGRVDLLAFYQRRARRLLPALFVFLAVMAALGVGFEVIVPTVFYYANWSAIEDGAMDPIEPTWSLSIEEQFYIVWPLALLGLLRWAPRAVPWVLVSSVLAAVALRSAAWLLTGDREWTFFATQHRADALALGCVLAVALAHRRWQPSRPIVIAAVGALGIASVVPSLGFLAIIGLPLATLGSGVLVAFAAATTPRVLGWRPLVYVGLISYALYLWHAPLLHWAKEADAAMAVRFGAVGLAFGLAALSRRYVELPFLHRRSADGKPLTAT